MEKKEELVEADDLIKFLTTQKEFDDKTACRILSKAYTKLLKNRKSVN